MKKHSDIGVLNRMLSELGRLGPIMFLTILFGMGGYLAATSIAVTSAAAAASLFSQSITLAINAAIIIIVISAVLRGFLRYSEQLCGHYIAFKILAILRDKVFAKLRSLAPAKLDTHDKGNLISIITSDIETMEVFYAHTIAPVAIAILTSIIYTIVLWNIHFAFGLLAAMLYVIIGFIMPIILKRSTTNAASHYRRQLGKNSSLFLESMRGLKEILQFGIGSSHKHTMEKASQSLGQNAQKIKEREGLGFAITDMLILLSMLGCLVLGYVLNTVGEIDGAKLVVAIVLLVSSFGPVVALSSLSTTLAGTIASARRVFNILDEEPVVKEIFIGNKLHHYDITFNSVSFSYPTCNAQVLKDINLNILGNEHVAITGNSGCGKSTIMKLIMRFYDSDTGSVFIGDKQIQTIQTPLLRNAQATLSQDAFLFNDTIENNIRMANNTATINDVIVAAKKAAIHSAIKRLPKGYQTNAGELGECFSSGEKQRIALARAFLVGSRLLLLDEPTSNLDVLSEAEILKSIQQHCKDQTVILVSHRKSTTAIYKRVLRIENGCLASTKL